MREFFGWGYTEAINEDAFPKTEPFFVVVTFHTRSEAVPKYHVRDTESYTTVQCARTWVLLNEDTLRKFVEEVSKTDTRFVFYKVENLGKMSVSISVSIDP